MVSSGVAEPPAGTEPTIVKENGVTYVRNGATPVHGIETMELKEAWRIGDDDADDSVILGLPAKVLIGSDGNLYLLDIRSVDVKVFSPDGRYLGSIGREGEGPGEFENASEMLFLDDTTLGVAQMYPPKIVGVHLDGTEAGFIRPLQQNTDEPDQGIVLSRLQQGGDNLVLAGIAVSFNAEKGRMTRTYFVRAYDRQGHPGVEYVSRRVGWTLEQDMKLREDDFHSPGDMMSVDSGGRVYVVENPDRYAISVYDPGGALVRVIEREYKSWKRNVMATSIARNVLASEARSFPQPNTMELRENESDIVNMRCAADGTLWVQTSRALFFGGRHFGGFDSFTRWDVFSREGVFLKQVQVNVPGRPVLDYMLVTDHGYVVVIRNFLDGALTMMGVGGVVNVGRDQENLQVICYKVKS